MQSILAIAPPVYSKYQTGLKHAEKISFTAKQTAPPKNKDKKSPYNSFYKMIPKPLVWTPKKENPVALDDIAFVYAKKFAENANKLGLSRTEYLLQNMKFLAFVPQVMPEPSKTAIVGKTNVTTLIDGEQIFDKAVEYIKSAKDSIQIEMFEFQHPSVDGNKWPSNGAEMVPEIGRAHV